MTRRPLLWLSALGAALGAVAAVPPAVGAQNLEWTITVETPATVDSHVIEIAGEARILGGALPGLLEAETATITVVPGSVLPPACAIPEPSRTVDVEGGRYRTAIEVRCNGPHRIEVVAHAKTGDSGAPKRQDVGVAETPAPPLPPSGKGTADGRVHVTWNASPHPDAHGWTLISAVGEDTFSADQLATDLDTPRSTLALRAVHWGAEGPGGPTIESEMSDFTVSVEYQGKTVDPPIDTSSTQPNPPPDPDRPGGGATIPAGTDPPSTSGPSRGTGAPPTSADGFSDTLPFGTRPEAFVPGSTPATEAQDDVEQAAGEAAPAGSFRTTEKTSPGLVAPFALAVMMLTVAAHIAWYLRRSRPGGGGSVGGGQVRPT
jgi:hypothetical protein